MSTLAAGPSGDLFRDAVAAIDAGDAGVLGALLVRHPELAGSRLDGAPPWLREQAGDAVDGFFARPWLLWFVAEDPIRNDRLPDNVLEIMEILIGATLAAASPGAAQKALDGALRLTSWSPVAARVGVQVAMMEALAAAGARPTESPDQALVNRNRAAAERLLAWGAPLTPGAAACLGRWEELPGLFQETDGEGRQRALVLAALNGSAEGVRRLAAMGVPVSVPSASLYAHATPLHHAVSAGSLETVKVLTAAGADLNVRDSAWHATPLGWAEYCASTAPPGRREDYLRIAQHLSESE